MGKATIGNEGSENPALPKVNFWIRKLRQKGSFLEYFSAMSSARYWAGFLSIE